MASTAHGAQRPVDPGPDHRLASVHGNTAGTVSAPVRITAVWSWRLIMVLAAVGLAGYLISTLTLVIIPMLIAALLAGLLYPPVGWLRHKHAPAGLAAGTIVLGLVGFVTELLVLTGQQVVLGFTQFSGSVVAGSEQLLDRMQDTSLNFGTANLEDRVTDFGATVQDNSQALLDGALSFGGTAGHVLTGILVLLFFLIDGERIWLLVVRLLPVTARRAVNGAGRNGWIALVQYARAQGLVAAIDAVGIGVGAALLRVPLALPIGILVFLGSFIPVVGAVATGAVAVLVALVANGTTNALLMLGVVVLVQQLEGNVLASHSDSAAGKSYCPVVAWGYDCDTPSGRHRRPTRGTGREQRSSRQGRAGERGGRRSMYEGRTRAGFTRGWGPPRSRSRGPSARP
ncbi:AI-2E family transporter [Kocuria sp. M1N1S27]|uniref:AI-2E family transporter n=1 Tax=Kocuria kalidii TaxID=3376283 RepID=UPI0037A0AAA5